MPRKNSFPSFALFGLVLGAVTLLSSSAWAQGQPAPRLDKSLEVQLFQTAIGPDGFMTVDSATVPAHLQWGMGLWFNHQNAPLTFQADQSNRTTPIDNIVKEQTGAELTAAIGVLGKLQFGLAVPVTLRLQGNQFSDQGAPLGMTFAASGIGDPRVEAKYLLTRASFGEDGAGGELLAALSGGVSLPLGDDQNFLGDKGVTGRVRFITEYRREGFRIAGILGALLRAQKSQVFVSEVGNQLMYGVGAEYFFHRQVGLVAEWFGRNGFSRYLDEAPMEIDGGLRVKVSSMLSITAGAGTRVLEGVGSPKFRGFIGAVFYPDFRDADGDGVYDVNDRCPDHPEDHDGYKDHDGCPDSDNDLDGIPDEIDQCPNDPEDLDQFQDEDGCPDPDNDNDGIPDLHDACPNAAEDGVGKNPKDGCPSSAEDTDGDGIVDIQDKCPDEPEDRDGFEDEDGCPDLDNDDDSMPDQFDNCPNEPEDADGFEDEDGCPDPDNDKDGFSDAEDQCPNEPETLNGNRDDDGCPDPGAEIIALGAGTIEVREPLTFRGTALTVPSRTLVKLIALLLKGHPEISRVSIVVTAGTSTDATRRADAIKNVLVARGVSAERLETAGKVGGDNVQLVLQQDQGDQ